MVSAKGTRPTKPTPAKRANQSAWPTTAPTRSGWPAPVYWATKVEAYIVVHWKSERTLQKMATAAMPAATASVLERLRRTRSRTICKVQQLLLRMKGQARSHNSRVDFAVGRASDPSASMRRSFDLG